MRNLSLVIPHAQTCALRPEECVVAAALNDELSQLFIATSSNDILLLSTSFAEDCGKQSIVRQPVPLQGGEERILALAASVEADGCVIGASDGSLFFLEGSSEPGCISNVGSFDAAILALSWSPDGEVLAIATASGRLLLMVDLGEVEAEVPIQQSLQPGGAAKVLTECDTFLEASVALTWRGDGQYLATASQGSDEPAATLRVWNRASLNLEHCGEASAKEAVGLQPIAAWQPNGRHIFCCQAPPGGNWGVSLFERNGLGHGSLPPISNAALCISALSWSSDSEILAIVLTSKDSGDQDARLQLWQRRNWHWYLLREHSWPQCTGVFTLWSETDPRMLYTVASCESGPAAELVLERMRFATSFCVSSRGSVAVIDGPLLAVTPLQHTVIPPPFAAARLAAGSAVVAAAWGEREGCEVVAAVTVTGELRVSVAVEEDFWEETVEGAVGSTGVTQDLNPPIQGSIAGINTPLAVTLLQHTVIPPPLAVAQLAAESAVVAAAWSEREGCKVVATVLVTGELRVCVAVKEDLWEETVEEAVGSTGVTQDLVPPIQMSKVGLDPACIMRSCRLACWASPDLLILVRTSPAACTNTCSDTLLCLRIHWRQGTSETHASDCAATVGEFREYVLPQRLLAVAGNARGEAVLHMKGGRVVRVLPADGAGAELRGVHAGSEQQLASFPEDCTTVLLVHKVLRTHCKVHTAGRSSSSLAGFPWDCATVLIVHKTDTVDEQVPRHFGLSTSGRLYRGNDLVAEHVTSACIRHAAENAASYVMYTVRNNTLHALPVQPLAADEGPLDLGELQRGAKSKAHVNRGAGGGFLSSMRAAMRPAAGQLATTGAARTIEGGAVLVAAPPGQTTIVLQMPRGNLEGVRLRLFTLESIAQALLQRRFSDAMSQAAQDRIDLNYLVDFLGSSFLEHAQAFVKQAQDDGAICDLLSALAPGSCVARGGKYAFAERAQFTLNAPPPAEGSGTAADTTAGHGTGAADRAPVAAEVAGHRTSAAEGVAAAAGATGYCTSATERTSAAAGTSPGPNGMAGGVVDAMEASVGEPLVVGFEASEAGAAVARACEQTGVAAADAPVDGDRNPEKPAFVSSEGPFPQKIARSCQALREACRARGGRFLRAVIMSHLKDEKPDHSEAVLVIKEVKEKEMASGSTNSDITADDLASFLLLHIDAEQAYRAALELYDLRMAYMLIAASQRDPAEHLEELEMLAAVEDPHMHRFAIDRKLRRHRIALGHVVAAGRSHAEEAREFAVKHGLMKELLGLLKGHTEERMAALDAYAQVLEESGKLSDAAVAYLACGNRKKAMRCYESAADWQMALPLLLQENPPPAAIRHMAQSLVDNLQAVGRHEDAGTVAATYLMDARVAVQCFVAGGCWRAAFSAVCQARGTARETLRQELLVPGAAAAAAEQLGEIVSDTGRVEKYWARLVQLRERRVAFAAVVRDQEGADSDLDDEGETASLASGLSAYTDASTKAMSTQPSRTAASTVGGRRGGKARRARKKVGKIRQGTPEEEQKLCLLLCELAPSPHLCTQCLVQGGSPKFWAGRQGLQEERQSGPDPAGHARGGTEAVLAPLRAGTVTPLCTQMSELAELLVAFGHEEDAGKLQGALDKYVKGFMTAAEDVLANPSPPASSLQSAHDKARTTEQTLRNLIFEIGKAQWKWDLLRPV